MRDVRFFNTGAAGEEPPLSGDRGSEDSLSASKSLASRPPRSVVPRIIDATAKKELLLSSEMICFVWFVFSKNRPERPSRTTGTPLEH